MIAEAEHYRLSRGSADGSSSGSPRDPQALDSNDFVNKVAKFEMISRGKPTATSPTAKSPPAAAPTAGAGGAKYPGLTSPGFVGEKVFSRDTATTRVPAAVLQGSGEARVISTCSSLSSSSLTSVSTLNCSSDSSGSSRSLTSPPVTPHGSWQPHAAPSPSPHPNPNPSPSPSPLGAQGPVFVTLGDRRLDGRGEPPPVVIRPVPEGAKPPGRGVVNGDASSSVTSPKRGSGGVPLRDSGSSREDSGSEKWHRDTFEGMDFDLSQMSEAEQELARRHREIVAERKREQEQEKLERQRLEEILRMCAEYQQEVENPSASGTRARAHPGSGGKSSSTSSSSSSTSTSMGSLKVKRVAAPPGFLDLTAPGPEADQDRRVVADANNSSSKPPEPQPASGDGDRKVSGEFRPNVTKIKTNGSLMLSSPSNTHKDGLFSFQMRRCESNSSTSEDEMLVGNSEDTGTIKRRPPQQHPTLPEEVPPPGPEVSAAHVSLDKNSVPCGATGVPSGSNVPSKSCALPGSKYTTVPVQHGGGVGVPSMSKPSVYTTGQNHSEAHAPSPPSSSASSASSASKDPYLSPKELGFSSPGQSRIDEILNSSFEAEREAAEMGSYGKFSVHINAQISCDAAPDLDDDDDDPDGDLAGGYHSKGSHSSTSSSKGSRSSVSSSHTVQENVVEAKEDTPTPVNSDSEPAEGDAFGAGSGSSPLPNGVGTPTTATSASVVRNREVSVDRFFVL